VTAEDVDESYGQEMMEMLEERAATPLNLNQVSHQSGTTPPIDHYLLRPLYRRCNDLRACRNWPDR